MAKRKLSGLILVIGGGATIIIMGIYNYQRAKRLAYNYEIIGVVQKVKYDIKQVPTITVKGKDYYLYEFSVSKKDNIETGDSIFKDSKTTILKVYRKYLNGGYYSKGIYKMVR